MKLSVLDQSPIKMGGTPGDAVFATIELAQLADRLGYTRYWLAEHHNTQTLASSTPEILIPALAAATKDIRVGSGGVMLSHYSPLKVAESFRMLETHISQNSRTMNGSATTVGNQRNGINQTFSNAASRSDIRSPTSSIPTDNLTRPSSKPRANRSSRGTSACVIVAG